MLVAVNDFEGELTLGQGTNPYTESLLNTLISKYEPRFMQKCIGMDLYEQLLAGLSEEPIPEKWNKLKQLLTLPCASYIYCYYMQMQSSMATGQGLVNHELETGTAVNPESKILRAWNELVCLTHEAHRYLNERRADYPRFKPDYGADILKKKNLFGL